VVRIAGKVSRKGTRIQRLTVTAPKGSKVRIRCTGGGCPFRRSNRTARLQHRPPLAQASTRLRVRRLEHRLLRPGATLKVLVTKGNSIGKYTRFTVRRRKPPIRVDKCLTPGKRAPVLCPAG
jgi:hypothetical protein